ncbi:uncharacterized protein LOC115688486 isoform X2 [Syzygium oleosum]|uniref:uncharacterized protein LOC115688486 isoform X2 n=1 Tax=Syzygium oleosum TaxID=219896 RepID=UPI0024B92DBF|nr:uncharacterized protein LOC115688486 isoform X2 [Syzygium oleosum]
MEVVPHGGGDGGGGDGSGNKMGTLLENFMRSQRSSLRSLFQRKKPGAVDDADSPRPLPFLSPVANSVVSRCSRILKVSTEELCHHFDEEIPESARQPSVNARNFVEFCSYKAMNVATKAPDYLGDKEFRRLTFDMMLAWESPDVASEVLAKEKNTGKEAEDGDGWSFFYTASTTMAVQVDNKKTAGIDAFARIAPACAAIADVITVKNLFYALTGSSCNQLHFLLYDKYLRSLDKVIKAVKSVSGPTFANLQLAEGEIILDIDGTVPLQPVLQHIGISAWPGRLTLTSYALYFESLGVGVYDKAVIYDLATDTKQVLKPELTGPLGARLFDRAVMYKSASVLEPVYMEFPELKGSSRRDYWLDICLEVLRAHRFARKNNFREIQRAEIIARAILGIFRYRAIREAFNIFPSNYKTILPYNLAESLPGGDVILETLASRLEFVKVDVPCHDDSGSPFTKQKKIPSPVSVLALYRLGFILLKEIKLDIDLVAVGDVCVAEINPLETALKNSILDTGRAEAAQASVDQELLFPVIALASRLQSLASWEDALKSIVFLGLVCYTIHRGWIQYVFPVILVSLALVMLWRRYFNRGKSLEAFRVTPPPNRNAVEQLLTLQDAISQVEALIQAANIVLLKIRALLFAVVPQATDRVALLLIIMAVVFAFMPPRYLILLAFVEVFTREMPLRKESSNRWLRRMREWWIRIPAAPVQLIKTDDKKNN